ncbi:MAG: hypothetical protein GY725_14530 [bacterium]|nr:hypothetical protein [bacterium]
MEEPPEGASRSGFHKRMLRAAMLEVEVYEEVEADSSATLQATGAVVLSSTAAGIGALPSGGTEALIGMTVVSLIGWYFWVLLTYLIGTKLLPEPQTRSSVGEVLRTIGFSSAPGIIRAGAILPIPGLQTALLAVAHIWMLAAMVVAVRQALDYTGRFRAIGVCLIGGVLSLALAALAMTLVFT